VGDCLNIVGTEGHGREQLAEHGGCDLGLGFGPVENLRKQVTREEIDVLREHAEHEAIDEVSDHMGVVPGLAEADRQTGKLVGHLAGKRIDSLFGL